MQGLIGLIESNGKRMPLAIGNISDRNSIKMVDDFIRRQPAFRRIGVV